MATTCAQGEYNKLWGFLLWCFGFFSYLNGNKHIFIRNRYTFKDKNYRTVRWRCFTSIRLRADSLDAQVGISVTQCAVITLHTQSSTSRHAGCSSILIFLTRPVLQALLQHLFAGYTLMGCNYNGQMTFDSVDKWLLLNPWSGRRMPEIESSSWPWFAINSSVNF